MTLFQTFNRPALGMALLAVASCYLHAPYARADVYRCTSSAGKTEFSDAPCARGNAVKIIPTRPNVIDTSHQREQSLQAENQALKDKLAARESQTPPSAVPSNPDAFRINSAECRTAKRDLEITASSIDKNPAMLRARESAMYGACGLREPDRTQITINNDNSGSPIYRVPSRR